MKWISIGEELPAVGQLVLVSYFTWDDKSKPRGYTVGMRDDYNNWTPSIPNPELNNLYKPTHWAAFEALPT